MSEGLNCNLEDIEQLTNSFVAKSLEDNYIRKVRQEEEKITDEIVAEIISTEEF
jgi:hypothetical protein